MNSFLFSHFHEHILQPFPDALQSSCSEKFRNISNEKGTPTLLFFPQQLFYRAPPVAASAFIKSN